MALTSLLKRAAQSRLAARAASFAIGAYIRFVDVTSSWRVVERDLADPVLDAPGGVILAFWHQRLLMSALMRRETKKRVVMLISQHRDGEIIAGAVKGYGLEFIRGSAADPRKKSKEKGGASAIAQMIAALEEGALVGMTPDGPRGPAQKVLPGIIRLAQLSGAPILPVSYSTSRGRHLRTWDRFFIACPFSRGVFAATAPIRVPADANAIQIAAAQKRLEEALNEADAKAEAEVARSGRHGLVSPR
ncbi:MAG TPA: lysophospholipid acyltransferase family protein [Parvularculaceae bacterium]|nr:lysophospholipid acyltransferase family protein [Parvularculaceae bacterium]